MSIRRLSAAFVAAFVLSVLSAVPVDAGPPTSIGDERPHAERPLTPKEQARSDAKAARAEAFVAAQMRRGAHLVSLACVTPTSTAAGAEASPSRTMPASCAQPSRTLSVEPRDQAKWYYCGPAVGQVISNYAWRVGSGRNKFSQKQIASWMRTEIMGRTDAPDLRDGLGTATKGSPRLPTGFAWVITDLRDTDGDGSTGDQLHTFVQSNVSQSGMPLAIPVKPHDPDSNYHLSSWPRPVQSGGHWIAAFGWYAYWSNTDVPHVAYADSSRDEGGSTGTFWDPTRHVARMIGEHTGRIVW